MASQEASNLKDEKPFYKRGWFIALAMIFLTPLGVFLWFKFPAKKHGKLGQGVKIAVSVFALLIWTPVVANQMTGYSRDFEVDGKKLTIECEQLCSYVDEYGDDEALKILASIGVARIEEMPRELADNKVILSADSNPDDGVVNLVLNYADGELTQVANADYPALIYYSNDSSAKVIPYPARQEIAKFKAEAEKKRKLEAEKKAKVEKVKAERKAREEAELRAAEARVPSTAGTVELCERQFHRTYPFEGSKVHSILGVVANSRYGEDSRLYKVEVTIQNAFGANYKAVMECIVKKTDDMIQVTTFNVY